MNSIDLSSRGVHRASVAERCLLVAVLGLSYWAIGHDWSSTVRQDVLEKTQFERAQNRFAWSQSGTNNASAFGYFLLGGVGFVCLLKHSSRKTIWTHPLTIICILYAAWCALSLFWVPYFWFSIRKVTILALFLLAVFGLARRIEMEDLCWIAIVLTSGYLVIGVLAEIAHGFYKPWSADYRFAGTRHPNDQAVQCAMLVLALGCRTWENRRRDWFLGCLLAVGMVSLILTKSRTGLACSMVALAVVFLLRTRGTQRLFVASAGIAVVSFTLIAYTFVSVSASERAGDLAAMGRGKDVNTLTGRIPLWKAILSDESEYFLIGKGYTSFWDEKTILKYSERFLWQIPHAHNAYLDQLLSVGIVGLSLYLALISTALWVALSRYRTSSRPALLFPVGLLVFAIVNGLTESKFPSAGVGSLFMFMSIAVMALHKPAGASQSIAAQADTPRQSPLTRWTEFSPG